MHNDTGEESLLRELEREISPFVLRSGILHRLFGRVKTRSSIETKQSKKGYESTGKKKMQDLFGIRVAVYFADDEEIVANIFKSKFEQVEESSEVDNPNQDQFGVRRHNLVLKLPAAIASASRLLKTFDFIDPTFEVQLRTVFSEGWHEVDHDLRYKCQDDWNGHGDIGRSLNGLSATLETCDWAAIQMFDELAWRHYKDAKWEACFRSRFRLRFQSHKISDQTMQLLNKQDGLAKELYRAPRKKVLEYFWNSGSQIPVTIENVIFVANRLTNNHQSLIEIEPEPVTDWLNEHTA